MSTDLEVASLANTSFRINGV